jgi:hypothetical protein
MEMNVEKYKVKKISRETFPLQIKVHQKQPENVEYLNCLGSTITNNARRTRQLNRGLTWQK